MQHTALRALSKINRNVVQNSRRLYSFKFEMTAAGGRPAAENSAPEQHLEETDKKPAYRYNVYQPRTTPVEKPSVAGDAVLQQKQNVRTAIEEQHLQPAMLPEYFQKHMEKNALINPNAEPNESDRINGTTQRHFQVSKTCANAPPLKSVKLASPFPEPVKMMWSRTVADDEKAEQMLAEARSQRNYGESAQRNTFSNGNSSRSISTSARRFYSSSGKRVHADPEKCKKVGRKGKKGCPKMMIANCPPLARTQCDRLAKQVDCKKQMAPYPAYSEFCHEDVEEKPSECKMCPWKPEENPNFKPPKKHLHTSASHLVRRRGLESDNVTEHANEEIVPELEELEGLQCDSRKPPCERPKNRRCPQKPKKEKKPPKKKECAEHYVKREMVNLRTNAPEEGMWARGCPEQAPPKDKCKARKFKFPSCEIGREDQSGGRCPRKIKKPKVKDCPIEPGKKCGAFEEIEMELSDDKDKKCPRVDMTVNKDMIKDDPCNLRKKGTTKICPGDLLKKKGRKPRKKASAAPLTPSSSKGTVDQPTTYY